MAIKPNPGQSIHNPRALPKTTYTIDGAEIGAPNIASAVYAKLRASEEGKSITVNCDRLPGHDRDVQFGKLVDLIKNDPWMRHVVDTIDVDNNKILFLNMISVLFS